MSLVTNWEKAHKNKLLHKGTPYYFSAVSFIYQNDFDAALMSMHNALVEDKRNNPTWDQAPGYFFLTLNDQHNEQYFKLFIDEIIGFIRDRLDGKGTENGRYKKHYHKTRPGTLTYSQLRSKFLDNKNINEDVKYFFVYSIIRIWHLRKLHKNKIGDKLMAPLIFANALFPLLLVLDDLFKKWNNQSDSRWKFPQHLYELVKHEGWISTSTTIRQYVKDIDVTNRSEIDFNKWCKKLIGFKGKKYKTLSGRVLSPLESDFVLSYGLRNFSAHNIKSQETLWNHYTEILQSILNCIFKVNELL